MRWRNRKGCRWKRPGRCSLGAIEIMQGGAVCNRAYGQEGNGPGGTVENRAYGFVMLSGGEKHPPL